MADFAQAFEFMMDHEDPKRSGKTTIDNNEARVRYGINEAFHPDLTVTGYFDTMSNTNALNEAKVQYNKNEWASIWGDKITDQRVAAKMLDMAVNMGVEEAMKLAQRAAMMLGVDTDGKMGPKTLVAINTLQPDKMLSGLVWWWNWFIGQEINNKPLDVAEEKGWRVRADDLPA